MFEVNCLDLAIASYQGIRGHCLRKIKSNCFIAPIKCDFYDRAFNYVIERSGIHSAE